ncbi:hypothetical protein D3C87_431390 [compost metagenome]
MKLFLSISFFLVVGCISAQTTIAIQDFDAGTPAWGYTNTSGATVTGNSAGGDRPASSVVYTSATTAFGTVNTTSTLNFANVGGLASYTSKYIEFRLASWSLGSTGNGADLSDAVNLDISFDGGTTYSNEIQVTGTSANNAFWHYTTGTGLATAIYDGNNVPTTFAPGGTGNRTTDGYSTVHLDLPNSCTQVRIRIRATNNATAERWTVDDIKLIGTLTAPCSPGAAPATNASAITSTNFCTSAQLNFTAGNGTNRIGVISLTNFSNTPVNGTNYSANTTYGSGSTIGTGNYVVMNGNGNTVTVTGLTAGTTYYFKVFEYNGTIASCNESYQTTAVETYSFTTQANCATPQIRSILADACSSVEGLDELVIIENGANPLSIGTISLDFPSGGMYCNSGCGTNTLGNNAAYINQLNTAAGCNLFTYADPIPAGAIIVVFTGQTPSYVFDYSTQCPSTQQYYAIFCNNTSTAGRFANSGTGTRTLDAVFGGINESVTYAPNALGGNGSFIDFDDAGNPTYRVEPNCVYPLGVELLNWQASMMENEVLLTWTTLSETNLGKFEVLHIDPYLATEEIVQTIYTNGNSESMKAYSAIDTKPVPGMNYYQLLSVDRDGKQQRSEIVAINTQASGQYAHYHSGNVIFGQALKKGDDLTFYNYEGKEIRSFEIHETSNYIEQELSTGVALVRITHRNGFSEVIRVLVTD